MAATNVFKSHPALILLLYAFQLSNVCHASHTPYSDKENCGTGGPHWDGRFTDPKGGSNRCCTKLRQDLPGDWDIKRHGMRNYYTGENYDSDGKGGHQLTRNTLAMEGRSFCIAGEHINQTVLATLKPLEGFGPLLEYNLDIGNHIHPDDPTKMNTHKELYPEYKTSCGMDQTTYQHRPAYQPNQPDPRCKNPYKVEVTEIHAHNLRLQNYLHIKVYAEKPTNQIAGTKNCPTGKMNYLMVEVRDSLGLPVGHFTDEIPCEKSPSERSGPGPSEKVIGTKDNFMPCMFSPRRGVTVTFPGVIITHSSILFLSSIIILITLFHFCEFCVASWNISSVNRVYW
jgi:hypothetical protein